MTSVLIAGTGVAGFAAARALAEGGATVTMVGPHIPFDKPPLTKHALKSGREPWLTTAEEIAELGITHVIGEVVSVSVADHTVTVALSDAGTSELSWERLILATGLSYLVPEVLQPIEPVVPVTPWDSALASPQPQTRRRVLVVGAGLLGSEAALTLAPSDDVTLVDMADQPVARLHNPLPSLVLAKLVEKGVHFVGGVEITGSRREGDVRIVETAQDGELEADLVIATAGTGTTLPQGLPQSVLRIGGKAVAVDPTFAVLGQPDMYAVGDVAVIVDDGKETWFPQWNHAKAGGEHVASVILGSDTPFTEPPFWYSNMADLRIQEFGDATAATSWSDEGELIVGRDDSGTVAAVLLVNNPRGLAKAQELLQQRSG